jgi:hypothetical protein
MDDKSFVSEDDCFQREVDDFFDQNRISKREEEKTHKK